MEQFIFDIGNRTRGKDGRDLITIKGDEHFHLSHVLRLKVNEKILVTDGKGTTCLCVIQKIGKDSSTSLVIEEYSGLNLSLRKFSIGMAALKPPSKLEFAIEKCTELGAGSFLLFNSERSEKINLRLERMAGIVNSAVKQSLQSKIPELKAVTNLEDAASQSHVYEEKIVLHEKSDARVDEYISKLKRDSSVIALVGPEGGFSEKEIDYLIGKSFKSISLGNRV